MNTPERIKARREALGLRPEDVAERVGINTAWYYDLEGHDDELTETLTLQQALNLAHVLRCTLLFLLNADLAPLPQPRSLDTLRTAFAEGIQSGRVDAKELPWEVRPLLQDANSPLHQPVQHLQEMAPCVGIDWRAFVLHLQGQSDLGSAPEN